MGSIREVVNSHVQFDMYYKLDDESASLIRNIFFNFKHKLIRMIRIVVSTSKTPNHQILHSNRRYRDIFGVESWKTKKNSHIETLNKTGMITIIANFYIWTYIYTYMK